MNTLGRMSKRAAHKQALAPLVLARMAQGP
jgi:hypothetical protein